MSLESVQQFFAEHAPDIEIIETPESTATVELLKRLKARPPWCWQHAFTASYQDKSPKRCR